MKQVCSDYNFILILGEAQWTRGGATAHQRWSQQNRRDRGSSRRHAEVLGGQIC